MSDELRAAEALAALRAMAESGVEYKTSIDAEPLAIDDRTVTTLFSVDNLDRVGDITPPSAFTKSIQERGTKIPHLLMHDDHAPAIARILSFAPVPRDQLPADVLSEYPDATGGMSCKSLFLKNARAQEVLEGITNGLYGASFAYKVLDSHRKTLPDGRTARVLDQLRLIEVSSVHVGMEANGATRSRLGKALEALEDMKAGRRHSRNDIDLLREIARLAYELGADNIELLKEQIEQVAEEADEASKAAPLVRRARTDQQIRILADIKSLIGRN